MSLILGVHSKAEPVDARAVVEEFSLGGRRTLETRTCGNTVLSTCRATWEKKNLVENEDGSRVMLFSGELFDFDGRVDALLRQGHQLKDRANSAEYALHAFEESGESALREMCAPFAFAICDTQGGDLVLANDSFGIYPLFVFESDDCVIFCSEYQPILEYRGFPRDIDHGAVAEYFALGQPVGGKTFFTRLGNLAPGTCARFGREGTQSSCYDALDVRIERGRDIVTAARDVADLVKKATQARMRDPGQIRCGLSAGADTRLILSSLDDDQRHALRFFTNRSPNLTEEEDRNVIIARRLGEMVGFQIDVGRDLREDEDFGTAFYDRRRVVPPDRKVLSGWHGGEFLGGCCLDFASIPHTGVQRNAVDATLREVFKEEFLAGVRHPCDTLEEELAGIKTENRQLRSCMKQMTRGFFTNVYGGSRAGWGDPHTFATRKVSVFWDTHLLRALLAVPIEQLADYRLYCEIYRSVRTEFAGVPTNSPMVESPHCPLPEMTEGREPKAVRKPRYQKAREEYLLSQATWERGIYRRERFRPRAGKASPGLARSMVKFALAREGKSGVLRWIGNRLRARQDGRFTGALVKRIKSTMSRDYILDSFVDFEAWHRRYVP
jgi:Glutamine amidotransferase domain